MIISTKETTNKETTTSLPPGWGSSSHGFRRVLEFQKPLQQVCRCGKIGCEICDIRLHKEDLHEVVDYSKLCSWLTDTHETAQMINRDFMRSDSVRECGRTTITNIRLEPPDDVKLYQSDDCLEKFNTLFNSLVSEGFEFQRLDNRKRLEVGIFVPHQDKLCSDHKKHSEYYGGHFIRLNDLAYIWRPETMAMQRQKILAARRGPETDLEKKFDKLVGSIYALRSDSGMTAGILEFNDPEATFMFVKGYLSVNDLPRYRIRWKMLSAHRWVGVDFLTAEQVNEMLTSKMYLVSDPDCRLESIYPKELRDEYGTPPTGKFKWAYSYGYGSDRIKVAINEKIADKEEKNKVE